MRRTPESRIIVFATYRDTVQTLVDTLTAAGIACERFVGQASRDAERGLSQKEQIASLARFREGEFKCLIATSVGEEGGLDVPSTDMVIFYEAVPSEIRSIQRKGRTGRSGSGTIVVLVTKGTSDETFRYVSQSRERAMVTGIKEMSAAPPLLAPAPAPPTPPSVPAATRQAEILSFAPAGGPAITIDDRETSSRVVGRLYELGGASIALERLEVGDYAIGDRILVERKTVQDFMNTLVERDLFGQIKAMADAVLRPVLIIEGEDDLYAVRNIHPNAIRGGTLAAITVDMGVALIRTRDADDTAETLYVLAQREGGSERGGERKIHPKKSYRSVREEQEYALAAFPSVGLKSARLLLEHFGSLKAIVDAEPEELSSVYGIGGEKTARAIWDLARRPYR